MIVARQSCAYDDKFVMMTYLSSNVTGNHCCNVLFLTWHGQ